MIYRIAEITLRGVTPLIQAQYLNKTQVPPIGKELPDAYEQRTWRNRMHLTEKGLVYIPAFAIKRALENTAKFLGQKVPGQRMKTFGNYFKAATIVECDLVTDVEGADVKQKEVFVPSNGITGAGSRVYRIFPLIPAGWSGSVKVSVLDENITNEVFKEHVESAGMFNGFGSWRPQVGGGYGRFKLTDIVWSDVTV